MKAALAALLLAAPVAVLGQAPPPYGYPPPPPPGYPPPPPQGRPPPGYYPPQGRQYYGPPPRSPFYIGFGLGWGDGSTYGQGTTFSLHDWLSPSGYSDDGRLGFALRAGANLTPQLSLGFDLTGVRAFGSAFGGADAHITIANYDAVLTFYPMVRGLFFRGGMGASTLTSASHVYGVPSDSVTYGGFNILGGIGYAFWLGGPANLTLNLDASRQFFSATQVDGSSFFLAYVGIDFY